MPGLTYVKEEQGFNRFVNLEYIPIIYLKVLKMKQMKWAYQDRTLNNFAGAVIELCFSEGIRERGLFPH